MLSSVETSHGKRLHCSRRETKFHTQTLILSCHTPQPLWFPVGRLVRYTKIDLTVRDGSSSCSREEMCWMERGTGETWRWSDREMWLEAQKAETSVKTDVMDLLQMYSWVQWKCSSTRHYHQSSEWHPQLYPLSCIARICTAWIQLFNWTDTSEAEAWSWPLKSI